MNKDRIRASGHNSPVGSLSRRGSQEQLSTVKKHPSAEDSSSTEVPGLEPAATSSTQPPDSTVTTSAKKLTKSVSSSSSGSSSSSASGNPPPATQSTQVAGGTPPGAPHHLVRVVVNQSDEVADAEVSSTSEGRACCPQEVPYVCGGSSFLGVVLPLAVGLGAFSDNFDDDPNSEVLRFHLPVALFATFILSLFLGGCLGNLYYQRCVRAAGG